MILPHEIAIICPTRNNPAKVSRLLNSIASQDEHPGQVLISESGEIWEDMLSESASALNITFLRAPVAGQVLQRCYAYGFLSDHIKVVIHFDDDITLEKGAFRTFRNKWNFYLETEGAKLGGLSFNVSDMPEVKQSWFRKFAFMSPLSTGKITRSGYPEGYMPVIEDLPVDWLVGGCSGWSREVIESHEHPIDFQTKWAVYEDVIFSYGASKFSKLFVACDAEVKHNEDYRELPHRKAYFYGKSQVIMRYFFITCFKDFSKAAFLWTTICQTIAYLGYGIVKNRRYFWMGCGAMHGLCLFCLSLVGLSSARKLAERLND